MPNHVCPRCQRTNPEAAAYCYFDGALLQGGGNGAAIGQFHREFVFPSGRRCKSFDEFAQGCQEEWVSARDLLRQGVFQQFFGTVGRADLARAAQEAMGNQDGDIGLTSFLGTLPTARTFQPKLDIQPRRLDVGTLLVGDTRRAQITISNQGQGQLQGTVKIVLGNDWLSFPGGAAACPISTPKEQKITLEINTQKLVSLQSHMGKLTVVSNGGVVELAVRVDIASRPFGKPPYPEVKTPRDMAVSMNRDKGRTAAAVLESGEVYRWYVSNNWNYPVQGQRMKGLAGVQQFFDAMGLTKKPPPLQVSQSEFRYFCTSPEAARFQVVLSTPLRKWVYAYVESDQPWLKVLTPQVSGPQKAMISFEIDGQTLMHSTKNEANLNIVGNAGQKLPVRVIVESAGSAAVESVTPIVSTTHGRLRKPEGVGAETMVARRSGILGGVLAVTLVFLALRICLVPVADIGIRGAAVRSAAVKLNVIVAPGSPINHAGGWLQLPWSKIMSGSGTMPGHFFEEGQEAEPDLAEFRHYFVTYFTRDMVLWLWWLGPLGAALWMWRRGGWSDLPWAVVAGSVAGVMLSASLACVFLVVDAIPSRLWDMMLSGKGDGGLLVVWILLAVLCWAAIGAVVGAVLGLIPPLRRLTVEPLQRVLARLPGLGWLG